MSVVELVDETLLAAVRHATGRTDVSPRPGQPEMMAAITETMDSVSRDRTGRVHFEAATGTGKSLAYSVPAALKAAIDSQRTVIATESLSLQAQLVNKDLPVVAKAVAEVTGTTPTFAIYKGWSNHGCAAKAAHQAAGTTGMTMTPSTIEGALTLLDRAKGMQPPAVTAARWTLEQCRDRGVADRDDISVDAETWGDLSVSSSECVGTDKCPFGEVCAPATARARAAEADIVVTNHAMVAIQAASGAPVVVGSRRLGAFRHLVIDEAHALPDWVRSQGQATISPGRIGWLAKRFRSTVSDLNLSSAITSAGEQIVDELFACPDLVATDLAGFKDGDELHPHTLADSSTSVEPILDRAGRWIEAAKPGLPLDKLLKVRHLDYALESLRADFTMMMKDRVGIARWYERDAAKASPVATGGLLAANLYSASPPDPEYGEGRDDPRNIVSPDDCFETEDGDLRYALSVTAVSATLPLSSGNDLAINGRPAVIHTPFGSAFRRSVLHVPSVSDADAALLAPGGRNRMSTYAHPDWAVGRIVDLVAANQGSALVLSATSKAGHLYTEALRGCDLGVNVYSQFDGSGQSKSALVEAWRRDQSGVLVGTRSMMTGVDAPGGTCSLVILDRIPRLPNNPVDEARVELLMQSKSMNKWAAMREVYAGDAAVLLAQAAGRLIRGHEDSGMVAILDPRLLAGAPWPYGKDTRGTYRKRLRDFRAVLKDHQAAVNWLAERAGVQLAAA